MQNYNSVDARFETDGTIRPLAFVWKEQSMRITDWGRQWKKEGTYHFLVMTVGDRIWELRFMPFSLEWSIHPRSQARRMI
jgi:hypothetical protein